MGARKYCRRGEWGCGEIFQKGNMEGIVTGGGYEILLKWTDRGWGQYFKRQRQGGLITN
jgi:hypothetical protein